MIETSVMADFSVARPAGWDYPPDVISKELQAIGRS
jgi:hypothetical protein